MRFGSVQLIRPFWNTVVALLIVYKLIRESIEKVKGIIDAIFRNWEMLGDFSVHWIHSRSWLTVTPNSAAASSSHSRLFFSHCAMNSGSLHISSMRSSKESDENVITRSPWNACGLPWSFYLPWACCRRHCRTLGTSQCGSERQRSRTLTWHRASYACWWSLGASLGWWTYYRGRTPSERVRCASLRFGTSNSSIMICCGRKFQQ